MNMTYRRLGLSIVVLGLGLTAFASAPRSLRLTTLPSASPLVALRFVFDAGSQDDPAGMEGIAALTAAMIAEGGSQDLTYEQILEKFYPMAAALSGDCRKEQTTFAGLVHKDNLAEYTKIVTAMITHPRFDPQDFERLRSESVDYVSKTLRGASDEELGKTFLQTILYEKHPYGHPDRGTVKALKALSLDDVKSFHRRYYTLGNLHIGAAGGIEEAYFDKLKQSFSTLSPTPTQPTALPKPTPRPAGLTASIIAKPAASTAISLGFPINVTRADDDFYLLAVANSYLGEHRTFNGKLMQDLRGKRGLNYGDYSYIEDFIQDGQGAFPAPNNPRRQQAFTIWIRPVPHDKAAFALKAALWELDRLVENGISPQDFETTRSFLANYSNLWVQTLPRRLGYAMDGSFYGRADVVTELAKRLPTMTVDQVNAAVRRHLNTKAISVSIVTKDAQGLANKLKSGEPTPLIYDTEGTPETILSEDKIIAKFPLKGFTATIVPVESVFEE